MGPGARAPARVPPNGANGITKRAGPHRGPLPRRVRAAPTCYTRRVLPVDLGPAHFAARLQPLAPPKRRPFRRRRAAVAAILRFPASGPEVLLIERAVRSEDRWSGHVSFPGGHADDGDRDLVATAVRETREEVGLDLERNARVLGGLPPVRAIAKGRVLPMTITPLVFHLEGEPVVTPGPEAAGWFWLPLREAASGALDARHEYRLGPVPLTFPCWRYEGRVVWGLTFGMLKTLLARVSG